MWTHEITTTGRERGVLQVYVRFTDDANINHSFEQAFALHQPTSTDWLKPQIIATLDRLNGLDANEAAIIKGAIDITPTPVEPPTAEELAKQQLAKDKFVFQDMAREVELGVRKADDAAYLALKDKISAAIDAKG